MFPYITLGSIRLYMTGLGIVFALITFIITSRYRCRIYKIQFWRLFYRIPQAIVIIYILGAYVSFFFTIGLYPSSYQEFMILISPHGYKFHFVGILIGLFIAIRLFFTKVKRIENKKLYSDVIFFSITASLIPLGIGFLLGDNFMGLATSGFRSVQSLHPDSALNRFSGVYPIGLFLSISMLFLYITMILFKNIKKQKGIGLLGLTYALIIFNIIILYQQYARYVVVPFGTHTLDIKQHVSIVIGLITFATYYKRKKQY